MGLNSASRRIYRQNYIKFIPCIPMSSQEVPSEAINFYDDGSFIRDDNSRREHSADNKCRPVLPPVKDRGYNFQPYYVQPRNFKVKKLSKEPFEPFQHFMALSLV